jgi:DNA polymerase-4
VTIKVRFHDFQTITRSSTVDEPLDSAPAILREGRALLGGVDARPGVRLLGLAVSGLRAGGPHQLCFDLVAGDDADADASWSMAERAVDAIRERFGEAAIGPASLTGPEGLRPKRPGDQQWGPGTPGTTG